MTEKRGKSSQGQLGGGRRGYNKMSKEKTKLMKINGITIRVVLPHGMNLKEIPNVINSRENHPRGLFLKS